jgi:hypothetical protein
MASSSHAPGTRSVFSGSESVRCPRRNPDKVWPKLSGGPSPVRYHPRSIKAFTSSYSGSVSRSVNVSLWTTPVSWSRGTHEGPLCESAGDLKMPNQARQVQRKRCRRRQPSLRSPTQTIAKPGTFCSMRLRDEPQPQHSFLLLCHPRGTPLCPVAVQSPYAPWSR